MSAFQQPLQGMRQANEAARETAQGLSRGEITSSRMVKLVESERMFEANASVFRAQSEMIGALLDVRR